MAAADGVSVEQIAARGEKDFFLRAALILIEREEGATDGSN